MSYTQEELNSIWQRLTDDPERDEFEETDVSEMVESFSLSMLKAKILTNTDTEQAIAFGRALGEVATYTDFDPPSDAATGDYARLRDNKEGQWGVWKNVTPRPG
jgi:hypothetical protein